MSVGWKFSRSASDEGRSGGNPSEYAFDHDLTDFVRETLQNSNDAGQNLPGPTEVTYRFQEFTGEELEEFQTAFQWSDEDLPDDEFTRESLSEHLGAVAEDDTDTTVANVHREVQDDNRLLVVTVEDENTHGLYGPEGGKGPFSALVLDELIPHKEDGSGAGGSYGLGKAVLWSWSGLKTVIFDSYPNKTDGNNPPRFIARSQLPSHESTAESYRYEGSGIFGRITEGGTATAVGSDNTDLIYKWGDEHGRPYSVWGEEALAVTEQLGLRRPDEIPGTSVSLIGFCEPGGQSQPDPEDFADEIASEASKWFWPAMLQDKLRVTIETPSREINVKPDTHEAVVPFIRCVQNRNETRDVLDQPGNVAVKSPKSEIEDKEESAANDADDLNTESGPVNVYARLADPNDSGSLSNKVALIRGAGMVVKYYDRNRVVYGGRDFHGVVLAGNARQWTDKEPTDADKDIDDYLKAAEPPRHDDWEYTKKLRSKYGTESRLTIRDFQRVLITDAIKDLIRQTREEGRLVAGRLADRLNIPEGPGERTNGEPEERVSGTQVLDGTSEISFESPDQRWEFSGYSKMVVEDYEAWQAEVALRRLDEENNIVGTVPIEDFSITSGDDVYVSDSGETVILRGGSDVDRISFRGNSVSDPTPGETKVTVKGKIMIRRLGR